MWKKNDLHLDGFSRRSFLKGSAVAGAAALTGSVFITRSAQAKSKVLKVGHIEAPNSATHMGHALFAKLVNERTNGSVQVNVFPSGQLGGLRDLYEGIRFGSVEITSAGPDYLSNLVPFIVIPTLYYIWKSPEHARRALVGDVAAAFDNAVRAQQMRILAWGELGSRSVFNAKRPIHAPADMEGLKVRVPEARLHMLPMRALGASPTPVAYAEVYTAMQTNIVDAAEAVPSVVMQQKFNEVSKYYSLTRHLYQPTAATIGERAFQTLDAKEQEIVIESAREAWSKQWDVAGKDNLDAIEQIKASGVAVNDLDTAPFEKIVEPTWKELVDPLGDEGWNIVKKIRDVA